MPAARLRDDRVLQEAPPRYDAYFGMLVTALVATIIALIFLWVDYSSYPAKAPAIPKVTTSAGGGGAAPASSSAAPAGTAPATP